jgi:hypothetical protein
MATVRNGNRGVLVVVDVQVGVVDELKIAMKWLSYPGRTNATATAEAVDYSAPGGNASR